MTTTIGKKLKAPPETWQWYGNAGHFICADDCRFHLTTRVGPWMVSTVGEMFPQESVREIYAKTRGVTLVGRGDEREADYMKKFGYEDIGYNRKYETMVFRADEDCTAADCNCGMPRPTSFSEVDAHGYNTRREATDGHYALCWKWADIGKDEAPTDE